MATKRQSDGKKPPERSDERAAEINKNDNRVWPQQRPDTRRKPSKKSSDQS